METFTDMISDLLITFPESNQEVIIDFLLTPNSFIGNGLPCFEDDPERRVSLFKQYLHPAEVF